MTNRFLFLQKTFLLIALVSAGAANGQLANSRQPIEVEADATSADAAGGTIIFSNIVIRQGDLEIVARRAESSSLDFDNSTWTFSGNVGISSPMTDTQADRMVLTFKNKQISAAVLTGAPMQHKSSGADSTSVTASSAKVNFAANQITEISLQGSPIDLERTSAESGNLTRGQAENINYNAISRDLELIGSAVLEEGDNQISGNQIKYNLRNQKVLAAASEEGADRVHITITPSIPDDALDPALIDSAPEEVTPDSEVNPEPVVSDPDT